ncbi:hypothetical protein K1719_020077 [Acacia pycnantha]|nr:hypothetical protein K1719_020077 [Acacia pycnantha]
MNRNGEYLYYNAYNQPLSLPRKSHPSTFPLHRAAIATPLLTSCPLLRCRHCSSSLIFSITRSVVARLLKG